MNDFPSVQVDHLYINGNYYKANIDSPKFTCFVKGDSLYKSISAASILAKTFHDDYINDLCNLDEDLDKKYSLRSNMGYGTSKHITGLDEYGLCKYHRKTFLKKYNTKQNLW